LRFPFFSWWQDVVISIAVIHHFSSPERRLSALKVSVFVSSTKFPFFLLSFSFLSVFRKSGECSKVEELVWLQHGL
jgi:hypothetical protein